MAPNFSLTHGDRRTIGISISHLEDTGSPEALDMEWLFHGSDHAMYLHNGRQFFAVPNRIQSAAMSMHWLKARAESQAVPEQQVDGFTRVDKISRILKPRIAYFETINS